MTTTPTRQIIPHLSVRDGAKAIDFYVRAFGAVEEFRLTEPGGRLGHAELTVGGARFMLADEYPEYDSVGPDTLRGTTVAFSLSVDDVDATAARAVECGATLLRPIKDEFYGERVAALRDPFGHKWNLTQLIEHITPDEMKRRFDAMMAG
jgi:PhnB protein